MNNDFEAVIYRGIPRPPLKLGPLTITTYGRETATPEILYDPALLHKIKLDLDHFIVGEDKNKLLLFLIGLTSFSDKPLGALITGESCAGKSFLMDNVLKFFPNVEEYTRITGASPDRIGQDFKNKILKVGELHGTEKAQATLRVWISEGKLKLLTTALDEETKKLTTTTIETNGIPAFITTTTSFLPDDELLNRLFLISIDERKEQTRDIIRREAEEFRNFNLETVLPDTEIKGAVVALGESPVGVVIPFADLLAEAFPYDTVKSRRDFKKLGWIIQAVAYLHQFQRPKVQNLKAKWKGHFVIALPVDFCMAWIIAGEGMKETLMGVQTRALKILKLFEAGEEKTAGEIAIENNLSQDRARVIANVLVKKGYLVRNENKKPYKYSLLKKTDDLDSINNLLCALESFGETELEAWLDRQTVTDETACKGKWKDSFIHPLTGQVIALSDFPLYGKTTDTVSSSDKESSPVTLEKPEPNGEPSILPNSSESDNGAGKCAERLRKISEMGETKGGE